MTRESAACAEIVFSQGIYPLRDWIKAPGCIFEPVVPFRRFWFIPEWAKRTRIYWKRHQRERRVRLSEKKTSAYLPGKHWLAATSTHQQQVPLLRSPGFPVKLSGSGKLHAPLFLSLRRGASAALLSAAWQEIRVRSGMTNYLETDDSMILGNNSRLQLNCHPVERSVVEGPAVLPAWYRKPFHPPAVGEPQVRMS